MINMIENKKYKNTKNKSYVDACILIAGMFSGWSNAHAYILKSSMIYANTSGGDWMYMGQRWGNSL